MTHDLPDATLPTRRLVAPAVVRVWGRAMPSRLPGASRRALVAGSALLAASPGVAAAGNKGKKPRGFAMVQIIEAFVTNPTTNPKFKIAISATYVLPEDDTFGEVGGGDFGPEVPITANVAQTGPLIVEHVRDFLVGHGATMPPSTIQVVILERLASAERRARCRLPRLTWVRAPARVGPPQRSRRPGHPSRPRSRTRA